MHDTTLVIISISYKAGYHPAIQLTKTLNMEKETLQFPTETFCMPHETQERPNSTNKLFDY